MPVGPSPAELPASLVAFAPRHRGRRLLRAAFPRRRGRLVLTRTCDEFARALHAELVDAAIVDVAAGEEGWSAASRAPGLPSIPFFALVPPRPSDAPLLARGELAGVADLLVEGVDDAAIAPLVAPHRFTARFARALGEPPPALRLESPLQREVWGCIVRLAGRPTTTGDLAGQVGVSREHLSRSFARGGAPTLKRVLDLVRVCAAAELAKNPAFDVGDVARVLGFASSSHLASTTQRLVGSRPSSLARLRTVDLVERFGVAPGVERV